MLVSSKRIDRKNKLNFNFSSYILTIFVCLIPSPVHYEHHVHVPTVTFSAYFLTSQIMQFRIS